MGRKKGIAIRLIVLDILGMRKKTLPRRRRMGRRLLEEGFFSYVLNPTLGVCPVRYCTRGSRKDRALCSKHDMERWRAKNPERAAYHSLRGRAKDRGLLFSISFEEFMEVAKDFPFLNPPKDFKDHLSIDRIDPKLGYESGNIQALTISDNVIKGNRLRYTPEGRYWQNRQEEAELEAAELEDDEVPF